MTPIPPGWDIPKDLPARLDAGDGLWEDDRWDPILLTVMTGTSYAGRDVPLAWQIEFDPGDAAFASANRKLRRQGIDPDGYGWADALRRAVAGRHPEIVDELHFGDTELDTCVVWCESEEACRLLIHFAWRLIHGE